ncbi:MAG: hypothetical protein U0790_19975 [Isosphaeraceae bacterium]
MTIPCPGCARPLELGPQHLGRRLRCPACGQVLRAPGSPRPAGPEPQSAGADRGNASPLTFAISVEQDTSGVLKGKYDGRLESRSLLLTRRGAEVARLPVGKSADYLGRSRVRLAGEGRDVILTVCPLASYPDRLARDLVGLGKGERRALTPEDYRIPRTLMTLAFLPAGIAAIGMLGGAIGGAIGGGTFAALLLANLAIIRRESWPAWLRAALALGLSLAAYGVLALVLIRLLGGPAGPPQPVPEEGPRRRSSAPSVPSSPRPGVPAGAIGQVEDPDGDSVISVEGRGASIEVPGTIHELALEPGRGTNAPRVVREVEGDFEVVVKVDWDGPPTDLPAPGSSLPFHGAGLLIWSEDRSTLIRLERAAFVRGGALNRYLLFERLGRSLPQAEQDRPLGEGPVWLRLDRTGNQVVAAFSLDGLQWQTLSPFTFDPGRCRVGIAAVNTAAKPLKARYSEYSLQAR